MKHIKRDFSLKALDGLIGGWGRGQNSTFSEYGQVVYQIKGTRSSLGLLLIFRIFVPQLWPLNYARIAFQLNILRTN